LTNKPIVNESNLLAHDILLLIFIYLFICYLFVAVNATRTTTNVDGKRNRDATNVPACRATAKRLNTTRWE